MEFKKVLGWFSDNKKETMEAIIVVSKSGIVKKLPYRRWNEHNKGYSNVKELIFAQTDNRGKQRYEKYSKKKGKYLYVRIRNKTYSVHRLVAMAWIPNPENKEQVNHKDGNRSNNNVENLEWCTNHENQKHAALNGIHKYKKLNTKKEVKEMIQLRIKGLTCKEIGKIYNVCLETVRARTINEMTDNQLAKTKSSLGSREYVKSRARWAK